MKILIDLPESIVKKLEIISAREETKRKLLIESIVESYVEQKLIEDVNNKLS